MSENERYRLIGQRIEQRRKELGLTLQEVSSKVGVTASTIQRYEKGRFDKIKLPVIEAIAEALNVNPEWLTGHTDAPMERITQADMELVKKHFDLDQAFLDAHFGVVHGSPERLQIGASIWLHTAADYDNTAAILLALAVLGRDQRAAKLKSLRELVDLISQAPDAKCEAIVDFAKFVAKTQDDN